MPMSAEFNSIILAFAAGYCYRERSIQVSADMYFLFLFFYFLCVWQHLLLNLESGQDRCFQSGWSRAFYLEEIIVHENVLVNNASVLGVGFHDNSIEEFIPLLRERMNVLNPFVRQFLVGWITVLDSVPDIDMLGFLPDFLDGKDKMQTIWFPICLRFDNAVVNQSHNMANISVLSTCYLTVFNLT